MSAFALSAMILGMTTFAGGTGGRAELRAAGGDKTLAVRVADRLLSPTLPLQLVRIRCERAGVNRYCGLTLSGVKFKQRVDIATFRAEVDSLVRGAFAVDPSIAEVDLWVTVPADAGKGAVVSGDFALPSAATVYATTVRRAPAARAAENANVFWDPKFRAELAAGSNG